MHETSPLTQTPQGSRSQFVGCVLRSNLNYSIACANVMQQEVSEGMDDFVPQSDWNRKHAPIHNGSGGSCDNGFHMAGAAAEPVEQSMTALGRRSRSKRYVSRWNHCAPHELSKVVDVSQAKAIRLILRVSRSLENRSNVFGAQPVRDSHFVEIGV